ncbi:aminoglycoside 3-N-acetyltransferase [Pseudonocardia sp. C8]|uniref:aminoglycoside 3-N-acetyltransferase n=1 Tax=Pseudonocardia sp. C8 TaxID=2762759 RepID=UPI001642FC6C|nr:aminoglycoside 3-N-acetyltransferase [Pseudonocardia sp. C8]MBC3192403.1 aminoglycoside 3-N-acetyltransferase [Pseudonocardia sp. C8]
MPAPPWPHTRADLAEDLRALGLGAGQAVLAHAGIRSLGPLLDGPDTLIDALLDAVAPGGTVLAYTDWQAPYLEFLDDGRVPDGLRPHVPPFDPAASRAIRDNGAFPEFLRTRPGARRSGSPGASIAALGADAEHFVRDHPLDYGYGTGSPLARLVAAGGKVAMVGAPWDTMTLLHHAEHLADLPGKRVTRYEVPLAAPGATVWHTVEEFDTSVPVTAAFRDDHFDRIVTDFVAGGGGRRGPVGEADTLVVDAADICAFAVRWLEERGR